jgi:malic enzyme
VRLIFFQGLGDLGANGLGIPIGKLQLYVAGAGFNPENTLPVILDTGTKTSRYLEDESEFYIGVKESRLPDPGKWRRAQREREEGKGKRIRAKWEKVERDNGELDIREKGGRREEEARRRRK